MQSASPQKRPLSTTLVLLALWLAFYGSFTLFTPALLDDADSVHAEVAREMLLRHDWITLYANGIRYLEKAPLLYWSMAACMRFSQLLGHGSANALAVAARIPLALTILALAFAVEAFARRAFCSARAGLYAALILLSSFGVFIFTRILLPDAMLCLWLTLAMLCFATTPGLGKLESHPRRSERDWSDLMERLGRKHRRRCYCIAACCALAVLTKGLIGIVFPIAIVVIFMLLTEGPRGTITHIGGLHPLTSTAVFLAIAAPWHILIALANPTEGHPGNLTFTNHHWQIPLPTDGNVHGWTWFYFVNEQLLRYLNLRVPRDYDTVPLYLFWGLCLVWLMPWFTFLVPALRFEKPLRSIQWPRPMAPSRIPSLSTTPLFIFLWAAVPLVFFSFSTRQEYYVLPSLPALAIMVAGWLATEQALISHTARRLAHLASTIPNYVPAPPDPDPRKSDFRGYRHINRILIGLLALGTIFAAAALYFILHTQTPAPNTDLAALLQQNPGDYALSMGHFLDLNAQALGLFRLPLALAAASLFLGPLASFLLRKRAQPHAATLALAAGAFGFLLAAHLGLCTFAPVLSSQQLAAAVAPQVHTDDLVVIHQEYEFGSTLGFYLQRNDLHILEGRSSNLWYGSFFPDAPAIFETPQSLAQKWSGSRRIFLWQDLANQPSPLPASLSPIYVIAKSGGKEIVSNQASPTP